MNSVKTRIAPSPTGRFHIGTARTALFNFLYARRHGGSFLIRIEDTDRERSKPEYERDILEGLQWLGLVADETVRQSEQVKRHTELLTKLIEKGSAYVSKEESKARPGETVEVVRLKNEGRTVSFRDEVRGEISFDTSELGDFVIARSVTDPLYHFAVVADDMDMGITHVIRGDDHISNTPRQILIQEALGAPRPVYVHLPLILDEKRAKLSKRTGATSVADYRGEGILSEALVNYLALLGWNPGDDREDFSLTDLIAAFTLEGIQKSGAAWDRTKLLSVNQRWIRKLSPEAFVALLEAPAELDKDKLLSAAALVQERARTIVEARELISEKGELGALFYTPELEKGKLLAKESEDRTGVARAALVTVAGMLTKGAFTNASPEEIKMFLMPIADQEESKGKGGRGAFLWPLRYALSGQERSPDPFTLIALLGSEESLKRIQTAIAILE
jgi:glutamyl-tRNA synthetase